MSGLYLTPSAIGYLTQLVLAGIITAYLASCLPHTTRPVLTVLLTGFFGACTLSALLLFLNVALLPAQRLPAAYVQTITVGLVLVFLLQFAYHFPRLDPRKKWESRLLLALSLLYTLWQVQFTILRYLQLAAGHVYDRPTQVDYALAIGFLWVPVVFIRQATFADERDVSWTRKIWQPLGEDARAARSFALVFVIALVLSVVNLLHSLSLVSNSLYQLSLSVGLSVALFALVDVYLNSLPEMTSFMVKLTGGMLTIVLSLLGIVGWVITPAYAAVYRLPLSDQQTLRFTPNGGGGYDVTRPPFHFDADLGRAVDMPTDVHIHSVPLGFTFPFFGAESRTVFVTNLGAVSIGEALAADDIQYHYGTTPAIFALGTSLVPGHGIFANDRGNQLTITWFRMPGLFQEQLTYTFQLVLDKSGVFDISYNGLPANLNYAADQDPLASAWMVGAVPGDFTRAPKQMDFSGLPLHADSDGLVQDYYLDFRRHLNQLLAPLAWLVIISIVLVAALPLLIETSLIQHLNVLLRGVEQVNAGNRTVRLPVRYHDEIGFLTESFNAMASQLHDLVANLEARVADRTRELSALYAVSQAAARSQTLETFLEQSLAHFTAALRCTRGMVLLVADGEDAGEPIRLRLVAHCGLSPDLALPAEMLPEANGWFAALRGQRQPIVVADVAADPATPAAMRALGSETLAMAPLHPYGDILGMVGVLRPAERPFTADEITLLTTVSHQTGAAVQNYRLRQTAQELALVEERHRLARDLHDSVTQALYGVTLFAKASQSSIKVGNIPLTTQYIDHLSETARQALKEMRLLIFELRPAVLEQVGLVGALHQRMEAVERRAGVAVEFQVAAIPELPTALESHIYQIAQEALNNILKHSGATWVALRLITQAGELQLTIQDNGKGFDPSGIGETAGLGFTTMRERAERIGGRLQISSAPGKGTRVSLMVPISRRWANDSPD